MEESGLSQISNYWSSDQQKRHNDHDSRYDHRKLVAEHQEMTGFRFGENGREENHFLDHAECCADVCYSEENPADADCVESEHNRENIEQFAIEEGTQVGGVFAPIAEVSMHDQAKPVINAPNNEVPRSAVPEPTESHGQ